MELGGRDLPWCKARGLTLSTRGKAQLQERHKQQSVTVVHGCPELSSKTFSRLLSKDRKKSGYHPLCCLPYTGLEGTMQTDVGEKSSMFGIRKPCELQ